jgi:hypothetical protein
MAEDGFDDRYVGFREHAAAQQRLDSELARIRERQATTEATLLHEVAGVRADVAEMKQLMLRPPPPPVDHQALVMQRAMDALTSTKPSGSHPFLTVMSVIGALAIGAVAVMIFTGV